ncbi:kinase-like domain-containing protein, partial [Flammula alnicola]
QINPTFKNSLLAALSRLSSKAGLHPRCFILNGIEWAPSPTTSGHFSDIWKGDFRGQIVCLKVIKIYQNSDKEQFLKAFSREAILWGHVSHPNLLPFYGIYHLGDEYGRMCLVSPWMDYGNINEYLLQSPSASRLLLISDIAAGLLYLHERDIVHGDLKGANILVTSSGRACLSDFGLSTIIDATSLPSPSSSYSTEFIGGTIRWQAPELFDPLIEYPRASMQSDVYAYGCVCYEVYTGEVPFYENVRDVTVIYQVMKGEQPSRPNPESPAFRGHGLQDDIWALMEDCWDRVPHRRPTMGQVISRLPRKDIVDSRLHENWEEQSASRFRNAVYRNDCLSMTVLETVLSWVCVMCLRMSNSIADDRHRNRCEGMLVVRFPGHL